ncbi:hypothetical protein ACQP1P_35055 [Dactylosporangium sp. CA-052675]|uniref:hypothetical protein n=1 Tax=Dactylosporangium sp. CA-052675 TaxID=3239927 RepID=UPI003D936F7E
MTQSPKLAALALNEIGRLLGALTEEQLAALAEGRAHVEFRGTDGTVAALPTAPAHANADDERAGGGQPAGETAAAARAKAKPTRSAVDLDAIIADIKGLTEEDAVERYLIGRDKELSLPLMRELADRIGSPVTSKGAKSKAQLRKNIAAGTAGLLNRPASVFSGSWDR